MIVALRRPHEGRQGSKTIQSTIQSTIQRRLPERHAHLVADMKSWSQVMTSNLAVLCQANASSSQFGSATRGAVLVRAIHSCAFLRVPFWGWFQGKPEGKLWGSLKRHTRTQTNVKNSDGRYPRKNWVKFYDTNPLAIGSSHWDGIPLCGITTFPI